VQSGACTGWGTASACAAPKVCTQGACANPCFQQSSGNRVFNAGFDTSLDGWISSSATWSSVDADGCTSSGSAAIPSANASVIASGCFPLAAGDVYNFGAQMIVPTDTIYRGNCDLLLATGESCDELAPGQDASTEIYVFSATSGVWETLEMQVTIPATIQSGRISCGPSGSYGTGQTYVDKVFMTKAPGTF
jgi:hypothetical protein